MAPAVSFLRVHNPGRFGDDLSGNRQMMVEVNRSNGIRKGIEITSSSIGIFGTLPVTDEAGAPTGSFEVSLEIEPLLNEVKKSYGFELGFFGDRNRIGSFVKYGSTHPELLKGLASDDDIDVNEPAHYQRSVNGVPYGVLLQPVYDYARKQIGVLAMAADFTETRSADGQSVVWQVMLALVSGILQIGVIPIMLRGKILRPLEVVNERVAAQAAGAGGDGPDTDTWCDEMRAPAERCDRLAARSDEDSRRGDVS